MVALSLVTRKDMEDDNREESDIDECVLQGAAGEMKSTNSVTHAYVQFLCVYVCIHLYVLMSGCLQSPCMPYISMDHLSCQ